MGGDYLKMSHFIGQVTIAFTMLLLASPGCKQNKRERPRPAPPPIEDFVAIGAPTPDRAWNPKDYDTAAIVLERLRKQHYSLLPEHDAAGQSGALFARIVSHENFAFARYKGASVNARVSFAAMFLPNVTRVLRVYIAAAETKPRRFANEALELQAYVMASVIALMEPINEFIGTLSPTDPKYEVRMNGLKKVRKGIAGMIDGALITITENHVYSDVELVRFCGQLETLLPQFMVAVPISESVQKETRYRLSKMASAAKSPELRIAIKRLETTVVAAVSE